MEALGVGGAFEVVFSVLVDIWDGEGERGLGEGDLEESLVPLFSWMSVVCRVVCCVGCVICVSEKVGGEAKASFWMVIVGVWT
jgi:hypothetical protein